MPVCEEGASAFLAVFRAGILGAGHETGQIRGFECSERTRGTSSTQVFIESLRAILGHVRIDNYETSKHAYRRETGVLGENSEVFRRTSGTGFLLAP